MLSWVLSWELSAPWGSERTWLDGAPHPHPLWLFLPTVLDRDVGGPLWASRATMAGKEGRAVRVEQEYELGGGVVSSFCPLDLSCSLLPPKAPAWPCLILCLVSDAGGWD